MTKAHLWPEWLQQWSSDLWHITLHSVSALGVVVISLLVSGKAYPAEIWIGAMEPVWRHARSWPANDYLSLFDQGAPWTKAASMVKVFLVTKKFVIESSDQEITRLIFDLKRRNIALALQGVPLVASEACGRNIESYGPPHHMVAAAKRIKQLGGAVQYVALDEPLFYGHEYEGNASLRACHSPIDKIAEETARSMAEIREVFPSVQIGDVEPFGIHRPDSETWIAHLKEWFQAYKKASGTQFAFLQADLVRSNPNWKPQFLSAVGLVRGLGIPLGVIYNGTPENGTDEEWTTEAMRLCHVVEGEMRVAPDLVVFQTWTDHPQRMLPDTDSGTLTNLVARYKQGCK